MKTFFFYISMMILAVQAVPAFSADPYNYLCGGDEDGCIPGQPDSCVCIASDVQDRDICFTYEGCVPVNAVTHQCASGQFNEKTEARCLATLWQSEPTPPCTPLHTSPSPAVCASECTNLYDCHPTR